MNNITEKRIYFQPQIELIQLDNEISLALQSDAPAGPGEPGYTGYNTQDKLSDNPFHT